MKIYTRTGDRGETGLLGGHRVAKSHLAVEVCGELDETNAAIGLAVAEGLDEDTRGLLESVQQDLFDVGAHVAACLGTQRPVPPLRAGRVETLEQAIDSHEAGLPPMTAFILPGGSKAGAALHLARTVCRRAERALVGLIEMQPDAERLAEDLVYLNRLADLLFVLARDVNLAAGQPETRWLPGERGKNGDAGS